MECFTCHAVLRDDHRRSLSICQSVFGCCLLDEIETERAEGEGRERKGERKREEKSEKEREIEREKERTRENEREKSGE